MGSLGGFESPVSLGVHAYASGKNEGGKVEEVEGGGVPVQGMSVKECGNS